MALTEFGQRRPPLQAEDGTPLVHRENGRLIIPFVPFITAKDVTTLFDKLQVTILK